MSVSRPYSAAATRGRIAIEGGGEHAEVKSAYPLELQSPESDRAPGTSTFWRPRRRLKRADPAFTMRVRRHTRESLAVHYWLIAVFAAERVVGAAVVAVMNHGKVHENAVAEKHFCISSEDLRCTGVLTRFAETEHVQVAGPHGVKLHFFYLWRKQI